MDVVTQAYMLEKRRPPTGAKLFLNQRVVPAAIDAAGAFEVSLQRLSDRTGLRPSALLIAVAAGAAMAGLVLLGRPRRSR